MSVGLMTGRLFVLLLPTFPLAGVATAQVETSSKLGTVRAIGQYELKLKPQKLRLTLNIRAQGGDAKSAIASFLAHKERVKKELVAMKADEKSIEFGPTHVTGGVGGMPPEMQAYESRFIAQVARAAPNVNAADIPKIYTAMTHVRAEWPLPTTDPDALALLPETLKEQVKARDLTGEKNKAKLEGRQQEKLEEAQAALQENMGYSSNSEETPPFSAVFITKVDVESRRKALKEAYVRAETQAALIASAAGHRTGELITLRSSDVPSTGSDDVNSSSYQRAYAAYAGSGLDNFTTDEVQSVSASELKFGTRVDVEFPLVK